MTPARSPGPLACPKCGARPDMEVGMMRGGWQCRDPWHSQWSDPPAPPPAPLPVPGACLWDASTLVIPHDGMAWSFHLDQPERRACAVEIARRWNAYPALLAACETALEVIQTIADERTANDDAVETLLLAAIRAARGEGEGGAS